MPRAIHRDHFPVRHLVVTGEARSPYWARERSIVASAAAVYRSRGDARRASARSASAAEVQCLRAAFTTSFGERLRVSVGTLAAPRLAEASASYRFTISGDASAPEQLYVDYVLLRQGRAQAVLVFGGLLTPPSRAQRTALARVVARRMATAMRGA